METKRISFLLISVILSINIFSQDDDNIISVFKEKVQKFYDILYNKEKVEFSNFYSGPGEICNEELKKYYTELTFDVSYDSITKLISKMEVHDEGYGFSEYAILKFGDDKQIFFLMGLDYAYICRIWLSSGEELYPKLNHEYVDLESLKWAGIINTKKNAYIDLHEQPDLNSKVTNRLLPNEVFNYCPIGKKWWSVFKNGLGFLGYIQKKDVTMYQDFPEKLKEKIK